MITEIELLRDLEFTYRHVSQVNGVTFAEVDRCLERLNEFRKGRNGDRSKVHQTPISCHGNGLIKPRDSGIL